MHVYKGVDITKQMDAEMDRLDELTRPLREEAKKLEATRDHCMVCGLVRPAVIRARRSAWAAVREAWHIDYDRLREQALNRTQEGGVSE